MRALYFSGDEEEGAREDDIPAAMADEVTAARDKLIEAAADVDDAIASSFLEGAPIEEAVLKAAIRKATIDCKIVPVLAGAALRNKGVQPLLDAVVDYLPSPLEVPPMKGTVPGTEEPATRAPDDAAPFSALAFKVAMDEGRKAVYLRIYSGVLKPGDDVQNARTRKNEKVARLFSVHANRRERIERAVAGSIVVAMGLKDAGTGDTLASPKAPIIFERIDIYEPVISARHRAEDAGGEREARPRAGQDGRRRSDLPLERRSGDGADDHPRDGRAAPRRHRRPDADRVRRRGDGGAAAGRLP